MLNLSVFLSFSMMKLEKCQWAVAPYGNGLQSSRKADSVVVFQF